MISAVYRECRENTYRIKPVDTIDAISRMSRPVLSRLPEFAIGHAI